MMSNLKFLILVITVWQFWALLQIPTFIITIFALYYAYIIPKKSLPNEKLPARYFSLAWLIALAALVYHEVAPKYTEVYSTWLNRGESRPGWELSHEYLHYILKEASLLWGNIGSLQYGYSILFILSLLIISNIKELILAPVLGKLGLLHPAFYSLISSAKHLVKTKSYKDGANGVGILIAAVVNIVFWIYIFKTMQFHNELFTISSDWSFESRGLTPYLSLPIRLWYALPFIFVFLCWFIEWAFSKDTAMDPILERLDAIEAAIDSK